MNEPRQSGEAVPQLQYARRIETTDLLQAYRAVGWYFVLQGGIAALSGTISAMSMSQVPGIRWTDIATSQMISQAPAILSVAGAIGMVCGRPWGAWVVVGIRALHVVALSVTIVTVALRSPTNPWTLGSASVLSSSTSTVLNSCVHAFLPVAMWHLCRKRGAWARTV